MTKKKEEKRERMISKAFRERVASIPMPAYHIQEYRDGWIDCLDANGISDTTESAAPAWVIDMMRTGKPVRCKVWDDDAGAGQHSAVDGYCLCTGGREYRYEDTDGTPWKHAEPIHAWKPKDGEAVLTRVFDKAEVGAFKDGHICIRDTKHRIEEVGMDAIKPFNYSNVGRPWSEI